MKLINKKVVNKLIKKQLTISIAESCTGGLLSSTITSVDGSSRAFILALVTYSNRSKINVAEFNMNINDDNYNITKGSIHFSQVLLEQA